MLNRASLGLNTDAQIGGNAGVMASVGNPVTQASVRYPWTDLNGDKFVQANEINSSGTPLTNIVAVTQLHAAPAGAAVTLELECVDRICLSD